jgi:short-subunit dehydrogenase
MKFDIDTCPVAGLKSPANVQVTGASSGIGQALLRELLENRHVGRAFAVSRSATTTIALGELQRDHGQRLQLIDADMECSVP